MNPQIKQMWLEALESNTYQQTRERLHDSEGFCCLGVLCDLYAQSHTDVIGWMPSVPGSLNGNRVFNSRAKNKSLLHEYKESVDFNINEDNSSSYLPVAVMKWAGLDASDPTVPNTVSKTHLSSMNDEGISFKEIAQVIRENL